MNSGSARGDLVDRPAVARALASRSVPPEAISEIVDAIPTEAIAVLLYGSYARGDFHTNSDVDIIVVSGFRMGVTLDPERISVSTYSADQLETASGTLYGMHLKRDGVVLHDSAGALAETLRKFEPVDPTKLTSLIREMSALLTLTSQVEDTSLRVKIARYLLRSALYARWIAKGLPSFSVSEIAERENDPHLASALSSHTSVHPDPTVDVLKDLCARLEAVVGSPTDLQVSTLEEAAAFNGFLDSRTRLLALMLLDESSDGIPYAEAPKVLL